MCWKPLKSWCSSKHFYYSQNRCKYASTTIFDWLIVGAFIVIWKGMQDFIEEKTSIESIFTWSCYWIHLLSAYFIIFNLIGPWMIKHMQKNYLVQRFEGEITYRLQKNWSNVSKTWGLGDHFKDGVGVGGLNAVSTPVFQR